MSDYIYIEPATITETATMTNVIGITGSGDLVVTFLVGALGGTIDWDDGSPLESAGITVGGQNSVTHNYAAPGARTVTITSRGAAANVNLDGSTVTINSADVSGDGVDLVFFGGGDAYANTNSFTLDVPNATDMTSAFSFLQGNPTFNFTDISSVKNFNSCFSGSQNITAMPPALASIVPEDVGYMFHGCWSMSSAVLFDTSNVTDFSNMFYDASSFVSIPAYDTSNGTNFVSMFYNSSFGTVPAIDTSSGVNFSGMFEYALGLGSMTLIDTSSGELFNNMFAYADALGDVAALDVSNGTSFGGMFDGCINLYACSITGGRYTISYSDTIIDPTEMNNIFTNLGTADNTGGQQTITQPPSAAGSTQSIATGKGWVVIQA